MKDSPLFRLRRGDNLVNGISHLLTFGQEVALAGHGHSVSDYTG